MNYKKLATEVLLHFIQPYPGLSSKWEMKIFGSPVNISINMILFSFCLLRIYVVIKICLYWSLFTNPKSMKVFYFFRNKNVLAFFYKSNLKYYAMGFVIFIFILFLYISALIFKVFENFSKDEVGGFSYIWNCFWFLTQTMTTSNLFFIKF